MRDNFYTKDLKYHLNFRFGAEEYEYLCYVSHVLNKPMSTVVRDIIKKEISIYGYKTTSIIHNMEQSTLSETEIARVD